ncbi:MAG: hypothetical protein HY210_02180 [Candidatus Omnitrophica bacterium]|nr:hypothetical protein [Candidatus Omnitrophota bacterium]
MSNSIFLQAFQGTNTQIPVWFMRQAGRYLPEYHHRDDIHDADDFSGVTKTIRLANEQLDAKVPLIGFAGSPFTVLTYLVEGGSAVNFTKTFRFINEHPVHFEAWMELLTQNTIRYLNAQKEAGAAAFQLFDSWAGILRPADFAYRVLPFVRRIFEEVDLPSIYFVRNCAHLLALMDQSEADFLSVDHTVVLGHHTILEKTEKGIQGNLFNGLLYADDATLEKETRDVLIGGVKHGRYIFNLSHGVFPDVEVDKLKRIVEQVHAFDKRN